MASKICNVRVLIMATTAIFILIQIRLFTTQSRYADRLATTESRKMGSMPLIQDFTKVLQQSSLNAIEEPFAAVVIIACNRPDYLERTIESVLKYQRSVASKFPIFVSQDGTNSDVKSKALSYNQIGHMQHVDLQPVQPERPGELIAYYKIARHYKWALDELFLKKNFTRVIILEDDMEIAPDFFEYFEATATLLDNDKSVMAVSSWNDNGQRQFVHAAEALYRSDFFPGLGWMLTKSTWVELSPKWPKAYWDDWLRLKDVHKNRQFIRPEICRTYNFGEHGSSMGQFFKQYLEPIKLNDARVNWKEMDLGYLMEGNFLKYFAKMVADAKPLHGADVVQQVYNIDGDVRIRYTDQNDFERIARQFRIFEEWKILGAAVLTGSSTQFCRRTIQQVELLRECLETGFGPLLDVFLAIWLPELEWLGCFWNSHWRMASQGRHTKVLLSFGIKLQGAYFLLVQLPSGSLE